MTVLVVPPCVFDGDRWQLLQALGPGSLLSALFCGFSAFLLLRAYYPADLARGFRPFVDLLLTWALDSKKPRDEAGRMFLIKLGNFGCGGRI